MFYLKIGNSVEGMRGAMFCFAFSFKPKVFMGLLSSGDFMSLDSVLHGYMRSDI